MDRCSIKFSFPIAKAEAAGEERLVTGIVLEPDVIDAHNDTISASVIKNAAHDFLAKYNVATELGEQHSLFGNQGLQLVESYIAPVDFDMEGTFVKKGTWIMTVKVLDDALWAKIKGGEITGFSIGGSASVPAEAVKVLKDAGAPPPASSGEPRPFLDLEVNEVSLVDAAANLRKFIVIKRLHGAHESEESMSAKVAKSTVVLSVLKDMGKIKELSKELGAERLLTAIAAIETIKAALEGGEYDDVFDVYKDMDTVHSLLWGAESDVITATFTKSVDGKSVSVQLVDADVKKAIKEAVDAIKSSDAAALQSIIDTTVADTRKSVPSPDIKQLVADLVTKAQGSGPEADQAKATLQMLATDIAPVTKAVEPQTGAVTPTVQEMIAKSIADVDNKIAAALAPVKKELDDTKTQLDDTKTQLATAKKELDDLTAGSGTNAHGDDQPAPSTAQVKKSKWAGVIDVPGRS